VKIGEWNKWYIKEEKKRGAEKEHSFVIDICFRVQCGCFEWRNSLRFFDKIGVKICIVVKGIEFEATGIEVTI